MTPANSGDNTDVADSEDLGECIDSTGTIGTDYSLIEVSEATLMVVGRK